MCCGVSFNLVARSMSGSSEVVLGEIHVVARLEMGSEKLILFPTDSRIIVARVGKRGAGEMAGVGMLGRLSGVLENLFKGGRESLSRQGLSSRSPREILASHRDNFALSYGEIVRIEVHKETLTTRIMILTDRDKLEFYTGVSLDKIENVLGKNLSSKMLPSEPDLIHRERHAKPHGRGRDQRDRRSVRLHRLLVSIHKSDRRHSGPKYSIHGKHLWIVG